MGIQGTIVKHTESEKIIEIGAVNAAICPLKNHRLSLYLLKKCIVSELPVGFTGRRCRCYYSRDMFQGCHE